MATVPYLVTASIVASLVGAVVVMLFGRTPKVARWLALGFSFIPLGLATYAFYALSLIHI